MQPGISVLVFSFVFTDNNLRNFAVQLMHFLRCVESHPETPCIIISLHVSYWYGGIPFLISLASPKSILNSFVSYGKSR